MINPTIPREVFRDHHAACTSCRELFAFARQGGDLDALDVWRRQLAAHLADVSESRRKPNA
jgi:hypothetical protein